MNLFRGLKVGVDRQVEEITHFFFAYDTLVFCKSDEGALLYFRCVLLFFQAISDLNINLIKFELVRMGGEDDATRLTNVLGYKRVELLIKYLGLHLEANLKM